MTPFANHISFDFRTGIRNRSLLLLNYLFPLAFYLLMGFVMPGLNPLFLDSLLPGMVVFAIYSAAILGLPDPLVQARDSGIFRSYKINGVPRLNILAIPALTTSLHLIIVTVIICLTAPRCSTRPRRSTGSTSCSSSWQRSSPPPGWGCSSVLSRPTRGRLSCCRN